MKVFIGLVLAVAIGIVCRLVGIPVPAPPAVVGALLVMAMTVGYILAGRVAGPRPNRTRPLCGGPDGSVSKPEPRS